MGIIKLIRQKIYERVVYKLRQHPFTFVPALILMFFVMTLPLGLYWIINRNFTPWLESPVGLPLLILFASIYYLFVVLYFYTYFVTFYLNLTIITNDRLVDINQNGLFSRTIAEVDLYLIQDATSEIKGFFPSIFDYGNVMVQTAGSMPRCTLHNVAHPHELRKKLLDLALEDRKYHEKN
ncbi:MAG: hypothetical protein COU29_02460 [Candidatus Magasanikbacteria bacterium CG10_big_fil_rev_8_21_14_0_10_36_32]|uniref:YdbS-like PH domain-containing protein n=1 Tax=Candidatus Magasanikbacteria bacterium CG10_big_fil_rev_8_21_14_0_10_36_32 TaxID=1974646 RepID=A0A2M6W761_9BACT|nr:MAG: hypothetical protein COU29_02460 [Candidatus Magasanikbacteria bacterium CG10_big_fil_rev_8_21_14_0_10_36_32]